MMSYFNLRIVEHFSFISLKVYILGKVFILASSNKLLVILRFVCLLHASYIIAFSFATRPQHPFIKFSKVMDTSPILIVVDIIPLVTSDSACILAFQPPSQPFSSYSI
jgi:hypothetical protein